VVRRRCDWAKPGDGGRHTVQVYKSSTSTVFPHVQTPRWTSVLVLCTSRYVTVYCCTAASLRRLHTSANDIRVGFRCRITALHSRKLRRRSSLCTFHTPLRASADDGGVSRQRIAPSTDMESDIWTGRYGCDAMKCVAEILMRYDMTSDDTTSDTVRRAI
jgi:hypothetical protein